MANMIPARVGETTKSNAERHVFDWIQSQLGDEWFALHSQGLAVHPGKPWTEIDFVLIGPQGVFCLEVKGGRIRRQNGLWIYTDMFGNEHPKSQGPFEQVGPAAAALRRYLMERLPQYTSAIFGYGVVTPDIVFDITGPDIIPEVVFDANDAHGPGPQPFADYIERIGKYWEKRIRTQWGSIMPIRPGDRDRLLGELKADFDLIPSLREQVGLVNDELVRLTENQSSVLLSFQNNPRIIVRGKAGTGKTLLAVEEARRLAGNGERVLLLCFNKILASYLRKALQDTPKVDAYHLHGFMVEMIERYIGTQRTVPPEENPEQYYKEYMPGKCQEALINSGFDEYDSLVVDETQDLFDGQYLEVLDLVVKGGLSKGTWRVFYDPNQMLFKSGQARCPDKLLQCRPAIAELLTNCRNTKKIAEAANVVSGIEFAAVDGTEGPEVRAYYYRDHQDQWEKLRDCLHWLRDHEHLRPEQIVILSHRRFERTCLSLKTAGSWPSFTVLSPDELVPQEGTAGFSTVASFKGLESDAVVVLDIDKLITSEIQTVYYVGSSRAKVSLTLFIHEDQREEYESRLQAYREKQASE
ncbi:MAG: NERD domain-containing protein, partial [Candidatus Marsarchaeota archaeon]|nr:NERD domain-containing protein [Candidatus Marsarchaeota archaeon]